MPHKYLLKEFEELARSESNAKALMERVSHRIHTHIPRYNWVGFYLADRNEPAKLRLGPYAGSFTPAAVISSSQGLCGAAAVSLRPVIADNVVEDPRYIQISEMVKSQISMPVVVAGRALAVFNVESYFMATFKPAQEQEFVQACAGIIGRCMERSAVKDLVGA